MAGATEVVVAAMVEVDEASTAVLVVTRACSPGAQALSTSTRARANRGIEATLGGNTAETGDVAWVVPTITLTKDNFADTIAAHDTVLVDFWAAWCGPCRSFAPTFEAAADRNPDMVFAKVDTEDQSELAGYFGIRSIPTLMVFREKVVLYSQAGALPPSSLDELISRVREVDMADVHRQIAEHETKSHPAEG